MKNLGNKLKKEFWFPVIGMMYVVAIIFIHNYTEKQNLSYFQNLIIMISMAVLPLFPIITIIRDYNITEEEKDERELYHEYLIARASYFFLAIAIGVLAVFSENIQLALLLLAVFLLRVLWRFRVERKY